MNIEQEIIEIKGMLQTLLDLTAPPPSVKTKMQIRATSKQIMSEFLERKQKRAERKRS